MIYQPLIATDVDFSSPADISKVDIGSLKSIFGDDKVARQVLNAAKRVSKKRRMSDDATPVPAPSPKKVKPAFGQILSPSEYEVSLALPQAVRDEKVLLSTVLFTNRAPLVLAFVTVLLKYTMPEQPISSRLSLAQAVTSMNSKNKALHVGLESGHAAEDEGWGEGQPLIRIMTRDVRVMKRWGYEWEESSTPNTLAASSSETLVSSQATLIEEPAAQEPALWGIDLEALKSQSSSNAVHAARNSGNQLPIFTAASARKYIMKAFDSPKDENKSASTKKQTAKSLAAERERNLGLLLGALELLYESWQVLSKEDLDKRAWGWYVRVRPEVADGAAGWGGRGNVKLSDILALRRPSS